MFNNNNNNNRVVALCVAILFAVMAVASARHLHQDTLPSYTVDEIAQHNSRGDIWVGDLDTGKVYDLSNFRHPGGSRRILNVAGTVEEFTKSFNDQHGGSRFVENTLERYVIGNLAV